MTKKIRTLLTLFMAMLFLNLVGCTGAMLAPEASPEEPTEESAPDPELAPVVEAAEVNYCLDCHTDKARLIDTAKPEVIAIVENEGEG